MPLVLNVTTICLLFIKSSAEPELYFIEEGVRVSDPYELTSILGKNFFQDANRLGYGLATKTIPVGLVD